MKREHEDDDIDEFDALDEDPFAGQPEMDWMRILNHSETAFKTEREWVPDGPGISSLTDSELVQLVENSSNQDSPDQWASEPTGEDLLFQFADPLPPQPLLKDLQKSQNEQKIKLEKMFQQQKALMIRPTQDVYAYLSQEQRILREQIEVEVKALNNLYDSAVLEPSDLQKRFILKQDFEIQLKQLELLILEIQQLVNPPPTPPWFVLFRFFFPFKKTIS